MNKLLLKLFAILFPFYPLLAWVSHFGSEKPFSFFLNLLFFPLAIYFLANGKKKLPGYLIFFILFTIFHLASAMVNNTIPADTNKIYFLLFDFNLFACCLFIVIENMNFPEKFMRRMNRNILLIVILSLIVSVIQIKDPQFFFNAARLELLAFLEGENRNQSIYSWVSFNSSGITFPVLVAILLNFYTTRSRYFFIIVLSGIVVSFLSKSRYFMISAIVAFSQLLFNTRSSLLNKVSIVGIFAGSIFIVGIVAKEIGYDIEEVISSRILEKDTDMVSAKTRILSYEVFMKKFPENPLLGVGPATRKDVADLLGDEAPVIHVGYLCYLYYYGIAGCFFLFLAIYYLLRDAWNVGKKYNFWGSFYGLLSFCLANMTIVYFDFSEMGIVLAVLYVRFYKESLSLEPLSMEKVRSA